MDVEIEDCCADIQMYFKQIIALTDLLIENAEADEIPNFLTLKELAESGVSKMLLLQKEFINP